jgi:hypothetical protein
VAGLARKMKSAEMKSPAPMGGIGRRAWVEMR